MAPSAAVEAPAHAGREGAIRSGRNQGKASTSGAGVTDPRPANWNASGVGTKRQRGNPDVLVERESTPGPNTPATTDDVVTPLKQPSTAPQAETSTGSGEPPAKKQRSTWSQEAVALGYETGTIKNSSYVLLAASGLAGMTVAAIVEAATRQRHARPPSSPPALIFSGVITHRGYFLR
jgi:hypothetical protein